MSTRRLQKIDGSPSVQNGWRGQLRSTESNDECHRRFGRARSSTSQDCRMGISNTVHGLELAQIDCIVGLGWPSVASVIMFDMD